MISRQNRAPTGRTSNRPSGDLAPLQSARSTGSLNSSRFNPPDIHSPIKRPDSKMSQSGSWSLPHSSRGDDKDAGLASTRSNFTTSSRKMTSQFNYGGRDFSLPSDRLNGSARNSSIMAMQNSQETSVDDMIHLSTREILQRLRDRGSQELKAAEDIKALEASDFNDYSRPRASTLYPHRTVFLDPQVNNISPSKTQTELKKKMRLFSCPHPSYDIDGDGDVSHEDYRLAKRFDFDGNGIIDPYERKIAKHVIADEFFSKHNEHMHVFGDEIGRCSHDENVARLSKAPNFERTLKLLKGVEDSLRGKSSKEMVGCMASVHTEAVKKNYYTDKFNTTAFTNFEAVPVTERDLGGDHNGSRLRLMESRRYGQKKECADNMKVALDKMPKFTTVKLKMPYD